MKRLLLISLISLFAAYGIAIGDIDRNKHFNLETGSLAIKGYDPVAYFSDGPKKGNPSLKYEYEGVEYRFANEENRTAFTADPSKYEPAYGGWCSYAMLDADKVEVDPQSFKIIEGKLYLFYNGFWGDTLKKWNKKLSREQENNLVSKATANWQKIVSKK